MSQEGKFMIYCLEIYRAAKNLTGKEVIRLFIKYAVLEYIISCYESLHTTGSNYIIEDIDMFIESRKSA